MERIDWHPLSKRVVIACIAVGAALMLLACSGHDRESAVALIAPPVPTDAQVIAVAEEIFPEAHPGVFGHCSVRLTDFGCPMTPRLQDRLLATKISICRCQNGSGTREIDVETYPGGAIAHVTMYQGTTTYDLIMILDDGDLLVDDQTCNADPRTSIYNNTLGPC